MMPSAASAAFAEQHGMARWALQWQRRATSDSSSPGAGRRRAANFNANDLTWTALIIGGVLFTSWLMRAVSDVGAGPRGHFGFVRILDRAKVGRRPLFLPNVLAFEAVPSSGRTGPLRLTAIIGQYWRSPGAGDYRRPCFPAPAAIAQPRQPGNGAGYHSTAATSSVSTVKLWSVFGPKLVLMATSAASRPRAISTRPMRGMLLRASKVYHSPPR